MDYDKMYEDAKKSGKLKHMAPKQIKFKEGDVICGKFLGREQMKSKDPKMPDYYIYTFERTEETVRFPISGSYDKGDGSLLKVDGVYALDFVGIRDIGKGKQWKEVDTIIISEEGFGSNGVENSSE